MGLDPHAYTTTPFIPPALLTVPEAMAALRLSRATVYDLIRSGELGSVKVGRSRRIPAQAVQTFVAHLVEASR
jgi:excisionase family DNA binding protein